MTSDYGSGRVISLSRFVLALVFFLAVWIDPAQPARDEAIGYPLLGAYFALSAGLLAASWNNWWIDHRLALPAHIVDIAVFLAGVYFTEAYASSFTSPFFTFFAFLLFSATVRWGWRATAATAAAATLLYFLLGLTMDMGSPDFDPYRFGRRLAYLPLLSLVIIWFGTNQQKATVRKMPGELAVPPDAAAPPIRPALDYAALRMGARRLALAWWDKEEPWTLVTSWDRGRIEEERHGPAVFGSLVSDIGEAGPFLFDVRRGRALFLGPDGLAQAGQLPAGMDMSFARRFSIESGLAVPIRASDYEGELFLTDVPGLCSDDLHVAKAIAAEINVALDRYSMRRMGEDAAVGRARLAIARDLHDSVAQVLSGAAFRLEALRSWIKGEGDPEPEIQAIKTALRTEHRNVRALIARLRNGGATQRSTDLRAGLAGLAEELARLWELQVHFSAPDGAVTGPTWLLHELQQLLREAGANATRHGRSSRLAIELGWDSDEIRLRIADDGAGFPGVRNGEGKGEPIPPWSIHSRVTALGGTLSLVTGRDGSELRIRVPNAKEEGEET